jgi:hypothetical protein
VFLSISRFGISSTMRWPASGASGARSRAQRIAWKSRSDFLFECRGAPASHAFAHELGSLRDLLKRVGAQVADERTDLGMEAAELDRLTVELLHKRTTGDPGSVNAFGTH